MIVVDSNVIAYFLIPGSLSGAADDVRRKDPDWSAPLLWRSEMRNILLLYLRQQTMYLTDIQTHMATAEAIFRGREYHVDSARVLKLASGSGCTAYDCEFVYLSEKLNVQLVTEDKKLLSAFPGRAISMAEFLL